jgi:hypothetical protein
MRQSIGRSYFTYTVDHMCSKVSPPHPAEKFTKYDFFERFDTVYQLTRRSLQVIIHNINFVCHKKDSSR